MAGKRHHFIPQFLQKGFASHSNQKEHYAWVYRKGDINPFNSNIKNIGLEGYFYSEDKESTLDDLITSVESDFASFVDNLRNNRSGKVDNKKAAKLIAHLEIRTKNLRESFKDIYEIFLLEMANFLQDQNKCERFVKKQVENELPKMLDDELVKRGIPRMLFPIYRQQFMPFVNQKIPELIDNTRRFMSYLALNTKSLLETSMKSGHIKALLNSHTPPMKVSFYEKLKFKVIDTEPLKLPLGDSAIIFKFKDDRSFKQFFDVSKKLLYVALPISSTKVLVGLNDEIIVDLTELPRAIASCSIEYFIANEESKDYQMLVQHISDAKLVSDIEVENILSDLLVNDYKVDES